MKTLDINAFEEAIKVSFLTCEQLAKGFEELREALPTCQQVIEALTPIDLE